MVATCLPETWLPDSHDMMIVTLLSALPMHIVTLDTLQVIASLLPSQVFDTKNPYLQRSDEYQKQMKNLKWLLGLPFEITVRIDTEYLQFNDAKDDLKDDALKRDAFLANVHTAVALDVCNRMRKGMYCTATSVKSSKTAWG